MSVSDSDQTGLQSLGEEAGASACLQRSALSSQARQYVPGDADNSGRLRLSSKAKEFIPRNDNSWTQTQFDAAQVPVPVPVQMWPLQGSCVIAAVPVPVAQTGRSAEIFDYASTAMHSQSSTDAFSDSDSEWTPLQRRSCQNVEAGREEEQVVACTSLSSGCRPNTGAIVVPDIPLPRKDAWNAISQRLGLHPNAPRNVSNNTFAQENVRTDHVRAKGPLDIVHEIPAARADAWNSISQRLGLAPNPAQSGRNIPSMQDERTNPPRCGPVRGPLESAKEIPAARADAWNAISQRLGLAPKPLQSDYRLSMQDISCPAQIGPVLGSADTNHVVFESPSPRQSRKQRRTANHLRSEA